MFLQKLSNFPLFSDSLFLSGGGNKAGRVVRFIESLEAAFGQWLSLKELVRDRLSWWRFLGFDLGAQTPDANTIRLFRQKLTDGGTLQVLFDAFDHRLRTNGYLAMGGQIVDATLIAAPKQRNTQDEKDAIKAGKAAQEVWPDEPAKAAQKDVDAR
jgi:transposase, IS5 family